MKLTGEIVSLRVGFKYTLNLNSCCPIVATFVICKTVVIVPINRPFHAD